MKISNRILFISFFALVIALSHSTPLFRIRASSGTAQTISERRGFLSKQVSVHAAGRSAPWISLRDGHDLPADYQGASKTLQALRENQARPLALASADFDEDGVLDLLSAYETVGGGLLTVQRGHADTIFPNSPEAISNRAQSILKGTLSQNGDDIASPFLLSSRALEISSAPQLLGTGDFDGDGHTDIVAATMGSEALLFSRGDGRGGFAPARSLPLQGKVTALATGDVNRIDGLADIIVGITGAVGPRLLVYQSSAGAIKTAPEIISLPAEAKSIALGQMDGDYPVDIAVAADHHLVIINGRDRNRSSVEAKAHGSQALDPQPVITSAAYLFSIVSVATGDFTGDAAQEMALLCDDGAARVLTRTDSQSGGEFGWRESSATALPLASKRFADDLSARALVPVRISSSSKDDLLVIDAQSHQLHVLINEAATSQSEVAPTAQALSRLRLAASLDVEGEPVEALPMRLNADALNDIVLLRKNQSAPAVLITAAAATFTVINTNDSGAGSLRDAIFAANANPGADIINFSIPGAGTKTIKPTIPLPSINGTVTIDGTTQSPGSATPPVEIDGSLAPVSSKGLIVGAASCVIRGLVVNGFDGNGIEITSSSNVRIEGNFLGTNADGTGSKANGETGVMVNVGDNNVIGGTTTSARNIISGNSSGGVSLLNSAAGNFIQNNYIGTDKTGVADLGNGGDGITLVSGNAGVINSIIGSPGAGNVISGNTGFGVQFFGVGTGNLIQANMIGADVTGSVAIGNSGGVAITNAASNTVGGTAAGAGNVISGNNGNGVRVNSATAINNRVQGNFIGTALNGSSPLANGSDGVYVLNSASGTSIGGAGGSGGNTIAFNGGNGVLIETGTANSILSNSIFSNAGLGIDLAPVGLTPNDAGDADSGANTLQNFPVLSAAASLGGGSISIQGTLNSTASTTFTLQFFASDSCDSSGNGEGRLYLGSATATTNGSGNAAFNITLPTSVSAGQAITATATNPQGNTSEFSACVTFGSADLSISQTSSPSTVTAGNKITYTITVTNGGPDAAVSVTVTDNLPASVSFVTCSSTGGGVCGGSGNNRIVSFNSIAPGASAVIKIDAVLNCSAQNGSVISNTAAVSSIIHDPASGNNSATATNTANNPPPLIFPTSASFASEGGDASLNVTITSGCSWTASSNAPWIIIPPGSGGTGDGTLDYSVAVNLTGSPRMGTISVAGLTFNVNQGIQPCSYSILPTSVSVSTQGASNTVAVTALAGCKWKATSNDDWISVTTGAAGSGNGTVFYTVAINTVSSPRNGSITIGGQTFTVTQAGVTCSYLLSPSSRLFGEAGTEDTFSVIAPGGCNWTATPSASWIIMTSETSGSGTSTISFGVRDNFTIAPRQGTITVAGQTFTIVQEGGTTGDCVFTLSPVTVSFTGAGGNGSVVVNCEERCAWGTSTNVNWITITSVGVGIGTKTVTYNVQANTGTAPRKGVITIAGKTHTIKQRGR
jgi:uncharacterized repeat protein (TIGR01451 family)